MTSKQIRELDIPTGVQLKFLQEIAAQLAEYNEHCQPHLVGFTYKGRPFQINTKELSAVGEMPDGKGYISVCGRPFTCDQPYQEVLKRLGMETRNV